MPRRALDQLAARRKACPVPLDAEDLLATWLGSDRLLLFAQIADPQDTWTVTMPELEPGRFQGLFFEDIEPETTGEVAR